MRLLAGFTLVCLALLALATWLLVRDVPSPAHTEVAGPGRPRSQFRPTVPVTVGATKPTPATQSLRPIRSEDSRPATRPVPATPRPAPTTAPAPGPAASPPATRWAEDPDQRAARRRLAAARETLRDNPYHDAALRDELDALATLRRWEEAVLTLGRLLELHPDDADLRSERAAILLQLERAVEAVGDLNRVVQLEPRRVRAWFNLAVAHQALGHLSDAEQAWTRVLALDASPEARAQRGQVRLDLHAWAAAAEDLEVVLQAEPDAVDAVLNLSRAYEALERSEEGRACLAALLDRKPRCLPVLNRLAELSWNACQAGSDRQAALRAQTIDLCRRSLEIKPRQPAIEALLNEVLAPRE